MDLIIYKLSNFNPVKLAEIVHLTIGLYPVLPLTLSKCIFYRIMFEKLYLLYHTLVSLFSCGVGGVCVVWSGTQDMAHRNLMSSMPHHLLEVPKAHQ